MTAALARTPDSRSPGHRRAAKCQSGRTRAACATLATLHNDKKRANIHECTHLARRLMSSLDTLPASSGITSVVQSENKTNGTQPYPWLHTIARIARNPYRNLDTRRRCFTILHCELERKYSRPARGSRRAPQAMYHYLLFGRVSGSQPHQGSAQTRSARRGGCARKHRAAEHRWSVPHQHSPIQNGCQPRGSGKPQFGPVTAEALRRGWSCTDGGQGCLRARLGRSRGRLRIRAGTAPLSRGSLAAAFAADRFERLVQPFVRW